MNTWQILPMTEQDWEAVREIYSQGIATGNATFEQSVPDWKEWDERHLPTCRLVVRSGAQALGCGVEPCFQPVRVWLRGRGEHLHQRGGSWPGDWTSSAARSGGEL